jgi:hypothetical protein
MEVEGHAAGKDFVLYPGGAESWNWSDTGTTHAGGIQPRDIDKLLAKSANKIGSLVIGVVLLSIVITMFLFLNVTPQHLNKTFS